MSRDEPTPTELRWQRTTPIELLCGISIWICIGYGLLSLVEWVVR